MAGSITHAFVSAIADGADTTLVSPQADWNANHVFSLGLTDISAQDPYTLVCAPLGLGRTVATLTTLVDRSFDAVASQFPMMALNMAMQLGGF
jgi:hypothetical protein